MITSDFIYNDARAILNAAFTKIMKVNCVTGEFAIYKKNNDEPILSSNFFDWIEIFAEEGNIHDSDKEKYINFYDLRNIAAGTPTQSCEYKRRAGARWTTVRAIIVKSSTEENFFFLCLTDLGGIYDTNLQ